MAGGGILEVEVEVGFELEVEDRVEVCLEKEGAADEEAEALEEEGGFDVGEASDVSA